LQYEDGYNENTFTFVNNILEGGTGKESWCLTAHSNSTVRLVGNNLHGNGTVSNCAVGRWSRVVVIPLSLMIAWFP
ncbi:MAG TPA: hypothetical protein PLL01_17670, partial [Rhodoferax sp.]|nr:hypothetical protein [Rhodoferax sp.]